MGGRLDAGRLYFGDGRSHFIDFAIDGHDVGENDVDLAQPGIVTVSVAHRGTIAERARNRSARNRDGRGISSAHAFRQHATSWSNWS